MSENYGNHRNHRKPPPYDLPLYMRLFPNFYDFYGYEYYEKRPQKRDAFEDFISLYAILGFYGAIRPNYWSGGYYYYW